MEGWEKGERVSGESEIVKGERNEDRAVKREREEMCLKRNEAG